MSSILRGRNFILLQSFAIALSGCLQTREDIKEIEAAKAMKEQVLTLQKDHADSTSRLEELMDQNRQLNGRIEELEQRLSKANQAEGSNKEEVQKTLDDSKKHSEILQDSIGKLENQVQALQEEIVNLRLKEKDKGQHAEEGKSDKKGDKKDNLKDASREVAKDKEKILFDSAQADFQNKKWKEAILNFDQYREKNPKGKFFAEATYKTGVCFQELGMVDEAKVFYNEVIEKFPSSDVSKKANYRLKSIKNNAKK